MSAQVTTVTTGFPQFGPSSAYTVAENDLMTATYPIAAETDPLALLSADPSSNPTRACWNALHLDPSTGKLWLDSHYHLDGTPAEVWHGLQHRYSLPETVDAEAITEAINAGAIDPLVSRIVEGFDNVWDGNNHVGRLSDDAEEADKALSAWCETNAPTLSGESAGLWSAGDWFDGIGRDGVADEYGITAETTDAELEALASRMDDEAREHNVVLESAYNYIDAIRDDLIADRD